MLKEERQSRIVSLLQRRRVRTQADLLRHLAALGVEVDQSTLSRDLAELGVKKRGGRYEPAEGEGDGPHIVAPAGAVADFAFAVSWFASCGPNMVVVSTRVGQAQPVALTIEAKEDPSIFATLAGDDTIYLAVRSKRAQLVALRRLKQWFGDKER